MDLQSEWFNLVDCSFTHSLDKSAFADSSSFSSAPMVVTLFLVVSKDPDFLRN